MTFQERARRTDKQGCEFELGEGFADHEPALKVMYDAFSPMAASQGLPPADDRMRHAWLSELIRSAHNLLAWVGETVVGHAALLNDPARGHCEYVIFVDREYRNRGVGTELTMFAMDKARSLGLRQVWLTVESYNFRAIRLYRKVGFQFCDRGERERTMVLHL